VYPKAAGYERQQGVRTGQSQRYRRLAANSRQSS